MAGRKPNQGMNWIAPERRHGIYARDESCCTYCRAPNGPNLGYGMDADHIWAQIRSSFNDSENVVTACKRCNNEKSDRSLEDFVNNTLRKRGLNPSEVFERIRQQRHAPVDREEGERRVKAQEENANPPPYSDFQRASNAVQEEWHAKQDAEFEKRGRKMHPPATGEGDEIEREIEKERNVKWTANAKRAGLKTWQQWKAQEDLKEAQKHGFESVAAMKKYDEQQAKQKAAKKAAAAKAREKKLAKMKQKAGGVARVALSERVKSPSSEAASETPRGREPRVVRAKIAKKEKSGKHAKESAETKAAAVSGERGGKFVITRSGKKRYVTHRI